MKRLIAQALFWLILGINCGMLAQRWLDADGGDDSPEVSDTVIRT